MGLGTLHGRGRLAILRRQIWVRAEPMIVHTYTAGKSIQSPVENFGTYVLKVYVIKNVIWVVFTLGKPKVRSEGIN